jgi:hypothetical protein
VTDAPDHDRRDDDEREDAPPTTDPRERPADPAGTRPRHDPDALLPTRPIVLGNTTLWAPPAAGGDDAADEDEPEIRPRRDDEAPAAEDDGDVAAAPTYSRYSHRVQFALGALLAIGAAGVVLLVAALAGNGRSDDQTITLRSGPAWSAWRPTATGGADAATQIADHVGRQYRLPNGQQLVAVTGGPLQIAGLPVTIAIQRSVAQGGDIDFVQGTGVLYRLCGLGGTDCRITYGKPSVNRHLLLAREALELALYSFRYLGVTETVVLMPPSIQKSTNPNAKATKAEPEALLFRRQDPSVSTAIAHPLSSTLSTKTPSVSTVTRSPDASTVSGLTAPNSFDFRFQESNQDARAFLVLNPHAG